jgi:hypothetical protein
MHEGGSSIIILRSVHCWRFFDGTQKVFWVTIMMIPGMNGQDRNLIKLIEWGIGGR